MNKLSCRDENVWHIERYVEWFICWNSYDIINYKRRKNDILVQQLMINVLLK